VSTRIVHCKKLDKDLPGLDRPPYKNDLGKRRPSGLGARSFRHHRGRDTEPR
jgi:Fe-S cluster biosynthesis and repair protein YggX